LRLPHLGQPLMHMQALRLQCGGLSALRQVLRPDDGPRAAAAPASDRAGESESGASPCLDRDVHRMVGVAHERHGSLTELPWAPLVAALAAWQPPRRGRAHK
jgi:hypothetical protein